MLDQIRLRRVVSLGGIELALEEETLQDVWIRTRSAWRVPSALGTWRFRIPGVAVRRPWALHRQLGASNEIMEVHTEFVRDAAEHDQSWGSLAAFNLRKVAVVETCTERDGLQRALRSFAEYSNPAPDLRQEQRVLGCRASSVGHALTMARGPAYIATE